MHSFELVHAPRMQKVYVTSSSTILTYDYSVSRNQFWLENVAKTDKKIEQSDSDKCQPKSFSSG